MAIFTPRGLKIRLSTDIAFTLMARLHPRIKAFEILKMVEGFELLPALSALIASIVLLYLECSPIEMGIWVCLVTVLIGVMCLIGLIPSFLIRIASHLSVMSGYGLFTIIVIIAVLSFDSWRGLLFYFIGRYSAYLTLYILELKIAQYWSKKYEFPVFGSELYFFHSYKLFARKNGVTTSINLKDGELEEGHWFGAFYVLEREWPNVTGRFTDLEVINDGRGKFEALERGREFLEGFKKLGYNRDRIGQSFIAKMGTQNKKV